MLAPGSMTFGTPAELLESMKALCDKVAEAYRLETHSLKGQVSILESMLTGEGFSPVCSGQISICSGPREFTSADADEEQGVMSQSVGLGQSGSARPSSESATADTNLCPPPKSPMVRNQQARRRVTVTDTDGPGERPHGDMSPTYASEDDLASDSSSAASRRGLPYAERQLTRWGRLTAGKVGIPYLACREDNSWEFALQEAWVRGIQPQQQAQSRASTGAQFALASQVRGNNIVVADRAGEEFRGGEKLDKLVIRPDSPFRLLWAIVGGSILLYDTVTIPLDFVGIKDEDSLLWRVVSLAFWTLDLPMQMFSGYTADGLVVLVFESSVRMYYRGWMAPDMVILLVDYCFLLFGNLLISDVGNTFRFGRGIRLIRLVRLGRLYRLKIISSYVATRIFSEYMAHIFKLVQLVLKMVVLSHYVACFWYALAFFNNVQLSWLAEYADADPFYRYSLSLHWVLTQFTPSTNDINPTTAQERIFAMVVALIAMIAFSSFISSYTTALNQLRMVGATQIHQRALVREFINGKLLSTDLGRRIQSFFDTSHYMTRRMVLEEDVECLVDLPESLLIRLHEELYMPIIHTNTVFEIFEMVNRQVFILLCHEAFHEHQYLALQDIFVDGTRSDQVYFLSKGAMTYRTVHKLVASQVATETQSWFSEIGLWVVWHHVGQLQAVSAAEVVLLNLRSFHEIMVSEGGDVFEAFRVYAILFASHAQNEAEADCVTDEPQLVTTQVDLAKRARDFLRMTNKGGRSIQGLSGRFSRKTATLNSADFLAADAYGDHSNYRSNGPRWGDSDNSR